MGAINIGPKARAIVERLARIDYAAPVIDKPAVESALARHFAALDQPMRPVRWVADGLSGYLEVMKLASAAAWNAARDAASAAARDAARDAAWNAARDAAWDAASAAASAAARDAASAAARDAARDAVSAAARIAASAAAWDAAWDAARDAAWNAASAAASAAARDTAWVAARDAAWDAARDAGTGALGKHAGVWLPFIDATEAGLWLYWVTPKEIICVVRPAIHVADNRLHRENGPAVEWPNGTRFWFWRGVQVPQDIIETPALITAGRILGENNAEVRRVMIERFGVARFVLESGCEVVDTGSDDHPVKGLRGSRLLRRSIEGLEPLVILECINSTPEPDGTNKLYHLAIDPDAYNGRAQTDVWAAMASTWRHEDGSLAFRKPQDYAPAFES